MIRVERFSYSFIVVAIVVWRIKAVVCEHLGLNNVNSRPGR